MEDFLKKLHFLAVEVRNMLEHNTVNSFRSQLYKKQLSIDCGKQFRVVLPFRCFGCFLFDWTTKLAPPSRLIRCKTKTETWSLGVNLGLVFLANFIAMLHGNAFYHTHFLYLKVEVASLIRWILRPGTRSVR